MLVLAGCQPPVPDSGAPIGGGVGFGDYAGYQAPAPTVPVTVQPPSAAPASAARVTPSPPPPAAPPPSEPQAIAAATVAALGTGAPAAAPAALTAPAPVAPAPAPAPAAPRPAASGQSVAAFALATSHAVGTPLYRRTGLAGDGRAARACARFAAAAFAQEEFLRRGGPERDPMGVDPDGDGYACGWDPAPFRQLGN